ncbi:MAG: hypothetical protein ACFFCD_10035 [Promethearchaeota archaeon]
MDEEERNAFNTKINELWRNFNDEAIDKVYYRVYNERIEPAQNTIKTSNNTLDIGVANRRPRQDHWLLWRGLFTRILTEVL